MGIPAGALVALPHGGPARASQLRAGDEVQGSQGVCEVVRAALLADHAPLLEVITAFGAIALTADHLILSHGLWRRADDLRPWDVRYYDTQLRRTEFGIDPEEVSAYFPLDAVWAGLLDITGEVFGLTYVPVAETRAWHPDVRLYEIHDRATGRLLALDYTDLFPRDGKFTHAAAFPLVIERRAANGTRTIPVSAIVANATTVDSTVCATTTPRLLPLEMLTTSATSTTLST